MRFDELIIPEGCEIVIRVGPNIWPEGVGEPAVAAVEMWKPSQAEQTAGIEGHALRYKVQSFDEIPYAIKFLERAFHVAAEVRAGRVPPGYRREYDGSIVPDLFDANWMYRP